MTSDVQGAAKKVSPKYFWRFFSATGCISLRNIPDLLNKKHLKNVGPIRDCEPPHAHSPDVATGTVARRLRIDVHDDNDNDNA